MFCGSCMHDNTLAAELIAQGHDALLIPTYTPIRTDEADVSSSRVFFGGINVYLQQKSKFFRWTPWFVDRLLDVPRLLRFVSRWAVSTQAEQLGDLTVSMLLGDEGNQRKEIDKLVRWLKSHFRPDIIQVSNVLISGMLPRLKREFGVPILGMLQGDDIYLDSLPEGQRAKSLELIRRNSAAMDGYIATSRYYADFMARYLDIPRERIDVVHPGLNLKGHDAPNGEGRPGGAFTVGYLARIAPEKGFHNFCEAYRIFKSLPGAEASRARVSGWLGSHRRDYYEGCIKGLPDFEHVDTPDMASKVRFLRSLDVLSVPTVYHEPKGLYVLEAMANGVPVVQPRHGSFPELVELTGGGLLVEPNDPRSLAEAWHRLRANEDERRQLGRKGHAAVHERFSAATMARATLDVYRRYVAA